LPPTCQPFPYTTLFRSSRTKSCRLGGRAMRNRSVILTSFLTVIFLCFAGIAGAQDDKDKFKARYDSNSENKEFNPHDFGGIWMRSEEHTSELQSRFDLV